MKMEIFRDTYHSPSSKFCDIGKESPRILFASSPPPSGLCTPGIWLCDGSRTLYMAKSRPQARENIEWRRRKEKEKLKHWDNKVSKISFPRCNGLELSGKDFGRKQSSQPCLPVRRHELKNLEKPKERKQHWFRKTILHATMMAWYRWRTIPIIFPPRLHRQFRKGYSIGTAYVNILEGLSHVSHNLHTTCYISHNISIGQCCSTHQCPSRPLEPPRSGGAFL